MPTTLHTILPVPAAMPDLSRQLSSLLPGESGQILRIDAPDLEMELLKLGVTVGDHISYAGRAPLRGPVAIRVHRTKILLRSEDARHIWINRA